MAKTAIAWADLLEIYLNSEWVDGDTGQISVVSQSILETLELVESSESASERADIAPLCDPSEVKLGSVIRARIGPPQYSIGLLTDTWDGFLRAPERRVEEPSHFFIKSGKLHSELIPASDDLTKYRAIIKFVSALGQSALFLDIRHGKLVYFGDGRIEVPVRYSETDFRYVDLQEIEALLAALEGDLHRDQKLSILGEAVISLVAGQPETTRFMYLMQNVGELKKRIDEGYKLFASSFSYTKIRGEIQKTQADYVARVHKTFTDIQGQLLGLPVSAIVVATQLKATRHCGSEAVANLAILGGACLFVALLIASCCNQWFTLKAIASEVSDQSSRLKSEFSEVSQMFSGAFRDIEKRICWHRIVLIVISIVSILGVVFTWQGYKISTKIDVLDCFFSNSPSKIYIIESVSVRASDAVE